MKPRGPTFKGCTFNDNKTAIRLHGDSTIDVKDSELLRNEIAVDHVVDGDAVTESEQLEAKSGNNGGNDHWYKKPVGIIAIGITTGTTLLILRAAAMTFFPQWFR